MSKEATPFNPFGPLKEVLEQFGAPAPGMKNIMESRRKDWDALIEADRQAWASVQDAARQQAEIVTRIMQEIQDSFPVSAKDGAAMPDVAKQAEQVRAIYERAMADITAVTELARKSHAEVMAGIAHRAAQSLQEMKDLKRSK